MNLWWININLYGECIFKENKPFKDKNIGFYNLYMGIKDYKPIYGLNYGLYGNFNKQMEV